jgi:hypothetical protein
LANSVEGLGIIKVFPNAITDEHEACVVSIEIFYVEGVTN